MAGDREDSEQVEPEVRHHSRPHREPGNRRNPPEEMLDVQSVVRGLSRYGVNLQWQESRAKSCFGFTATPITRGACEPLQKNQTRSYSV